MADKTVLSYMVNILVADVLVTQEAKVLGYNIDLAFLYLGPSARGVDYICCNWESKTIHEGVV